MLSTAYERPCKLSAPKSIFPSMASLTTCRLADLPEVIQKLGSRIHGYHLNQNDGVHDSHLSYYAPEGIISKKEADQIIQAAAFYSPNANLILEYGPYEWICKEGIYEDFRQICQAAGC